MFGIFFVIFLFHFLLLLFLKPWIFPWDQLLLVIFQWISQSFFIASVVALCIILLKKYFSKNWFIFLSSIVLSSLVFFYFLELTLYRAMAVHVSQVLETLFYDGFSIFLQMINSAKVTDHELVKGSGSLFLMFLGVFFYVKKIEKNKNISIKKIVIFILLSFLVLHLEQLLSKTYKIPSICLEEESILPLYVRTVKKPANEDPYFNEAPYFEVKCNFKTDKDFYKTYLESLSKKDLKYQGPIFFFVFESMRESFVNEENAKNLFEFKKENFFGTDSYSNSNATNNSWFSILFGRYPAYFGAYEHEPSLYGNPLVQSLKKVGYESHVITSSDLKLFIHDRILFGPEFKAASSFIDHSHLNPELADKKTLLELNNQLDSIRPNSKKAFFIFFESAHHNYAWDSAQTPFKPFSKHPDFSKAYYSYRDINEIRNCYKNSIYYLDTLFQKFVQKLKQTGLYDKSLIVVTGDHGEEFYENGHFLHAGKLIYEQNTPPIYFKFPGLKKEPTKNNLSHVQIVPTILDFLGLPTDSTIFDGISALKDLDKPVLLSQNRNLQPPKLYAIIVKDKKYYFDLKPLEDDRYELRIKKVTDKNDKLIIFDYKEKWFEIVTSLESSLKNISFIKELKTIIPNENYIIRPAMHAVISPLSVPPSNALNPK